MPEDFTVEGPGWDIPDHLLPVLLKSAEKRALDLVSDWPWLAVKELAGLLGVSRPRASQLVNPLEGFGLVGRPRDAGGRLALTDRGLALLARRDRTSIGVARKRWSIASEDAESPYEWRNVSGRRTRQLLRNVEHTQAVHAFLAALSAQARLLGWEVVQLDPPARASRYFRHQEKMRSINPDAFGVLRKATRPGPSSLSGSAAPCGPQPCRRGWRPTCAISLPTGPPTITASGPISWWSSTTTSPRPTSSAWQGMRCRPEGSPCPCGSPTGRPSSSWGRWEKPGAPPAGGNRPRPCRRDEKQPQYGSDQDPAAPIPIGRRRTMRSRNNRKDSQKGPRRRGGRTVVRLNAAALWERLALLNRSQNWLAREIGVSPGYLSMLVNGGRAPSGRIRRRMLKALGRRRFPPAIQIGGDR